MKTIYFTRKNPVSHCALVSAVKPTGFEGTFPDYPDGTVFVEIGLEYVEPVIGKTLIYGDVVEGECTDEQFDEMFN